VGRSSREYGRRARWRQTTTSKVARRKPARSDVTNCQEVSGMQKNASLSAELGRAGVSYLLGVYERSNGDGMRCALDNGKGHYPVECPNTGDLGVLTSLTGR